MRKFTSKIWGVPGKIKEYYSPGKFQADKRIVPLNANPLEAWDTKNSRYRRVDLIPKEVPANIQQMDGINESSIQPTSPVVSPSPTPSVTPSLTPSVTPTSTPIPIDCIWNLNDEQWENNTNNWEDCVNVPTPTPSVTPTNTNTPTPSSALVFDSDAEAYLNAVVATGGTLSPTISAATNTLFVDLKSNGLYSKLDVLYLFLGGVSASNALNAIRTNSAFDITWNGGMTFDASGATGNGTNGYGNTNYNPQTQSSALNHSWGVYQTIGNFGGGAGEKHSFGSYDGTYINCHRGDSPTTVGLYGYTVAAARNAVTVNDFSGLFIGTFSSGGTKTISRNLSSVSLSGRTSLAAGGTANLPNQNYYTHVLNLNGVPYAGQYYNGTLRTIFAGDYLTNSEANTIDSLINTFNTTLNRNLY